MSSVRRMPVSLHLTNSFDAAWQSVILPWFEKTAPRTFEQTASVAVITPFRSHAQLIRSKLLARGISLLGVRFLVPAQLREFLLHNTALKLPLREHLRLLLAIAADEFAANIDRDEPDSLIARAVARDPDYFLRLFDELGSAGWEVADLVQPGLGEIAATFKKMCRDCGFTFVHEADRGAAEEAAELPPRFSRLLVTGFDGAYWPLWPLLHAAVKSAHAAVVVLNDPRDEARHVDETWIGTWEEIFGEAVAIPEPHSNAHPSAGESDQSRKVHFLVGADTTEQARAIVALTARFLCQDNCERVGILFPQKGALPRIVASFFSAAQIVHNDAIAHLSPSVFDDDALRAWLELEENPQLKFLCQFLRAADPRIFDKTPVLRIEEKLRDAYSGVLIDNIEILRQACARSEEKADVARAMEKIHFLPAVATFSEFLRQTKRIFAEFNWKQRWNEIERLSRGWFERVPHSFSKEKYLGWLREILTAPSTTRDDYGAHPYSRVHLMLYAEAESQPWSHLIFAGLNEEAWPSLDEEFVDNGQINEFNQQNKKLNKRAVKRGRHGEGQWSIVEGKTFLLGPFERRQIRRRRICNLLESAPSGIGATANLYSENSPSRIANPVDFFSRLYFETRGRGVSQQTLQALEEQTRTWLGDWSPVDAQKTDSINVGRTRYAYDMRRAKRPFGEYEFALRAPPEKPITMRVTQWESAVKYPAMEWMRLFLGVESEGENGNAWATATGQWVHHWLAESVRRTSGDAFVDLCEVGETGTRLVEHARKFRDEVYGLCVACGRPLPDWWESGWSNALYIADRLATKLSGLATDWTHMAPEWPLDSPTNISVGKNEFLRVRGRIDLILARGTRRESRVPFDDLWLIDYKTGRQRGLYVRERRSREASEEKFRKLLAKGRGVQLALYALAMQALGASDVQLALLGLADELESQFRLADVRAQKDFWRELYRIQETGIFGMHGPIRADYGFAPNYPLATLGVDEELLKQKWVITHPKLALDLENDP
jgi:hypothetical protein